MDETEVARVMYRRNGETEWYLSTSNNVGTGLYSSIKSAQRAILQFKGGYYANEYKVQTLQCVMVDYDQFELDWCDVE